MVLTIFNKNAVRYKYIGVFFIGHGPIDSIGWIERLLFICGALDGEHYMNLLATSALHKLRAKVSIMIQPSVSFFAPVRIRCKLAKLLIEPFD